MSFTNLETGQSSIAFTFAFFIFIPSSPITTFKKFTSLTFYLHFSSLIYKSFFSNLFNISATNSLYFFSVSVPTIILSETSNFSHVYQVSQ